MEDGAAGPARVSPEVAGRPCAWRGSLGGRGGASGRVSSYRSRWSALIALVFGQYRRTTGAQPQSILLRQRLLDRQPEQTTVMSRMTVGWMFSVFSGARPRARIRRGNSA